MFICVCRVQSCAVVVCCSRYVGTTQKQYVGTVCGTTSLNRFELEKYEGSTRVLITNHVRCWTHECHRQIIRRMYEECEYWKAFCLSWLRLNTVWQTSEIWYRYWYASVSSIKQPISYRSLATGKFDICRTVSYGHFMSCSSCGYTWLQGRSKHITSVIPLGVLPVSACELLTAIWRIKCERCEGNLIGDIVYK